MSTNETHSLMLEFGAEIGPAYQIDFLLLDLLFPERLIEALFLWVLLSETPPLKGL